MVGLHFGATGGTLGIMNAESMTIAEAADESPVVSAPRWGHTIAWAFVAIGLAVSAWMAFHSDGVYHEDDLTHFLMARWSGPHPAWMLHTWGRPGFTTLYALPAQFGWLPARLFTAVLTAFVAWLAYEFARRQGIRHAWIVPLLVWVQPLMFTLSYTTLTEPVLALYWMLALRLLQARRLAACAVCASLCALTRHEAFLLLVVFGLALWRAGASWRTLALLASAPFLHNLLFLVVFQEVPLWTMLAQQSSDEYGSGTWLTMPVKLLLSAGVGITFLAFAGSVFHVKRRCAGPLLASAALYFVAHIVFFRFGLFASGGYARFLTPLAPLLAILAAEALDQFRSVAEHPTARRRATGILVLLVGIIVLATLAVEQEIPSWLDWASRNIRIATGVLLAAGALGLLANQLRFARLRRIGIMVAPTLLLVAALAQPAIMRDVQPPFRLCAPLALSESGRLMRSTADWLRESGLDGRRIVTASAWAALFLERIESPFDPLPREQFATMRPGDLLWWDARQCPSPRNDITLEAVRVGGFRERWRSDAHHYDGIYCYVFEKLDDTNE